MKKYENYKNSGIEWIGEIPRHWEVNKVKHNFSFQTGFTPPSGKSEYYENGSYIWINISDLQDKFINDSSKKITDKAIEDYKPDIVPKGSLLYSFKLSVGRVGFNTVDCYTNEAIFAIKPDKKTNLNFFYYSLPNQIIQNANENIYGAKILNQELIKNAYLITPPPAEQTGIASYLDQKTTEIDQLIADKEALLKLYAEEKTAVINDLVTGKIVWNGNAWAAPVEVKDSGIEWLGEIPAHWEVIKLKNTVSKVGSGITPRGGAEVYQTQGIPLLRSQNVYSDGLRMKDVAYISEKIHNSMINSKVLSGDVLLNITGGSIGRAMYIEEWLGEANVNQHVCIVRPLDSINTKFLYYILISQIGQEQIQFEQTGSGREGLNFEALKNFYLPLPSVEIQHSTVDYIETELEKIDSKIKNTQKLIDLLKEYREVLISEVVTGKVKVV